MLVIDYKKEYFDSIVQLEKQIYPPQMRLGPDSLREDLSAGRNRSKLVFSEGELVGYIIACEIAQPPKGVKPVNKGKHSDVFHEFTRELYISDLNCTNKTALWNLLICFFEGVDEKIVIHAECRENSYKLLKNRRFKKAITILNCEKMPGYYSEGEDAVKVSFFYNRKMLEDWRMEFIWSINTTEEPCELGKFFDIAERQNISDDDIRKSKAFVLKTINERNLDIYRMLGSEVPVDLQRTIKFSHQGAFLGYLKKLKEAGFEENSRLNPGEYIANNLAIEYCQRFIQKNTTTYNDLSSARYFYRSIYKQSKPKYFFAIYDKYGAMRNTFSIPYCNSVTWDTTEKYFSEGRKMMLKAYGTLKPKVYGENMPDRHFRALGRILGFNEASRIIHKIIDRYKEVSQNDPNSNFIHDWNIIISKLVEAKALLTKGAVISCLDNSYNAALKICDSVEAINTRAGSYLEGKRKSSVKMQKRLKAIRKDLSRRIRTGQELETLLIEISKEIESLNAKKYNLTKSEKEKISTYIERMGKYVHHIDTTIIIRALGKTFVKKMLAGKCNDLFIPKSYSLSTAQFCAGILETLKTKTRKAMRLYSDLKKGGFLESIISGVLTEEQQRSIEAILKFRNCVTSKEDISQYDFCARVEEKCSPEFLVAGNASVCCMSFGAGNAVQYAKEEGVGVLNIYYKDRIIANSVIWIDDGFNCLVLDNVEVHPNYKKFNEQIQQLYMTAASGLMKDYELDCAVQGSRYNDLNLYSSSDTKITFKERKARRVQNQHFYSDADEAYIIKGEALCVA